MFLPLVVSLLQCYSRHMNTGFPLLLCCQIDSEEWNKTQGQTVLRTWEVESLHNYENNQDVKMVKQKFVMTYEKAILCDN